MTEANQRTQKAVIILGMHRSGTSALAGVLNLLGVDLGKSFLPPNPDNPKGYWEHLGIYDTHERLLNSLGRVWHSVFPFPQDWWLDPLVVPYRQRLVGIIRDDFSHAGLWGFKDPRLCRLMPVWHSIFETVACQPHFVCMIRNPEEVAESLRRRDGFSRDKCYILWLLHAIESEKESRAYPRVFVRYDQVLKDWRATVDRISDALGLEWPNSPSGIEKEVSDFLSADLRHHRIATNPKAQGSVLDELVAVVYQVFLEATEGNGDLSHEAISSAGSRLVAEMATPNESILMEELKSLSARLSEVQGWVSEFDARAAEQEARHRAEMDRVFKSYSWKVTAPLRRGYDLIYDKSRAKKSK